MTEFVQYPKEALEAYGKASAILKAAFDRNDKHIPLSELDQVQDNPPRGFTKLFLRSIRERVLTDQDQKLIAYYLNEVPGDLEVQPGRISNPDMGVFQIAMIGKRAHTMTPAEAAKELEVSQPMVTKLMTQGKIDAVKIDGRWLISPHSVTKYRSDVQHKE